MPNPMCVVCGYKRNAREGRVCGCVCSGRRGVRVKAEASGHRRMGCRRRSAWKVGDDDGVLWTGRGRGKGEHDG